MLWAACLIVPIRMPRRFNSGTNLSISVVFPLPDLPTIDKITGIQPPNTASALRNSFAVIICSHRFAAVSILPTEAGEASGI
jgi:hypothetical protein